MTYIYKGGNLSLFAIIKLIRITNILFINKPSSSSIECLVWKLNKLLCLFLERKTADIPFQKPKGINSLILKFQEFISQFA